MKNEIIEKYFIANNTLLSAHTVDQMAIPDTPTIYEVIRVTDGIPVFLERHLDRLIFSAETFNASIGPLLDEIKKNIFLLIKENNFPNKNIKLIVYHLEKEKPDYFIYFIKSVYPDTALYQKGVSTVFYKAERNNPNAKVVNLSFKERVNLLLEETGAYEALLLNENNEITEGSRSNVFFVKGHCLVTAPKSSVLIGITRVYVFEICHSLGIEIVERPISADELQQMDGLFLSGTSPKILPICSVGQIAFDSANNEVIQRITKTYDAAIEKYISEHR